MALFEVEGKSKIEADRFITTSEAIVKSTEPTSHTDIKATNFIAGEAAKDFLKNRDPIENGLRHKIKDYTINHSIGLIFTVAGAILTAVLVAVFGIG